MLAILFFFNFFGHAQIDLLTQAKPYRMSVVEHKPFVTNKKITIAYNRIYIDARPLVGVTPVLPIVDAEFEADFYACLTKQTNAIIAAVEKGNAQAKAAMKNIFIGIRQYEGTMMDTLCRPAVTFTGPQTFLSTACYASRSSVNKEAKCSFATAEDIGEMFSHLATENTRREQSFTQLQSSAQKLFEMLTK